MLQSILLVLTLASSAHAQHETAENKARTVPGGASKGVAACHDDIERLCKSGKPGEGRLGACLNGRVKDLSASCLNWAAHGGNEHIAEALLRDLDGKPLEKKKMIESYDVRVANPYGEKLSTKPLTQGGTFKVVSIAIPAGQELAGHQTSVPAMLFVVEGQARFIAGTAEIALVPGTMVPIPPGVVHRIVATKNSHFVLVK